MGLVRFLDKLSVYAGSVAAWLVAPLMLVVAYEVIMRKLFNAPTAWTYDVCWMLFSAQFLLGGGYTLLRKGHIRIDIVYGILSDRAKMIYDVLIEIIVILPPMILLTWAGIEFAADAWSFGEKLSTTNWFFPSGPPKTLIPIGFFLLALQCLAEIIRNINELKKGGRR